MTFVGFALIALAPGIFWLWFFVRKDIYRPVPRRMLAMAFGLGCISTIPALIAEFVLIGARIEVEHLIQSAPLSGIVVAMLLVVGPAEETCKFVAAWIKPYRSIYFDEPIDGLVFAAAASVGFASIENFLYVMEMGPAVMLVRAPVSTLGHMAFSCIWGYAYGLHQASNYRKHMTVAGALVLSAVVHGVFDILLLTPALGFLGIGMVFALGVWAFRRFQWGQKISPFRFRRNYPTAACAACGEQVRLTSRYCPFCGVPAKFLGEELVCGNCRAENHAGAAYCTSCGDRLLRM